MNKHKIYSAFVKVLADTITPVGAYLKMRDHYPNALLLESSDYHSKEDSFSFICLQPMAGFEASERKYSISNLAIVIRSILSKNNTLTYQAGAGIVVGSTPQGERKEIDNKVAAIRRAIISAVEI